MNESPNTVDQQLLRFIDAHVALVEPVLREAALAEWELQTTSSPESQERSAELNTQIARIYANTADYAFLRSLDRGGIEDPMLARQHELLLNEYRGSQIPDDVIEKMVSLEVSIAETFNSYRPLDHCSKDPDATLTDNQIDDILMSSLDSEQRRAAWLASREVGSHTAERVLELVRLRNNEAVRLGFSTYYTMSMTLQEQETEEVFELLDELHLSSENLWLAYKADLDIKLAERFGISPGEVRPWHHYNRFFQEPGGGEANLDRFFEGVNLEEPAVAFFERIGLPIEDLMARADLYEREGKCQHAFCLDVDRMGDVRVLCNNRSDERWMSTTLHEFGHAVYDKYVDRDLPFLLRSPAHTLTTEAIALFMGRLTKDAAWLTAYAGVDSDEAARIAVAAQNEVRDYLLVFMRWCFVMCHFERELYRDPDQDLDTLWWYLTERFQGISCRAEDRKPGMWAAKIHIATAPVYYHNYLLGEMVASQLLHYLRETVLSGEADKDRALVTSDKVGRYMVARLFRPGATLRWENWLAEATGEPLNPAYYVDQLKAP